MSSKDAQKRATKKYLENVKRITVDLDPKLYRELYEVACCRSITVSAMIRELIMYHVVEDLIDED